MTTYVIRDGELVEKSEAAPLNAGPYLQPDIAAYQSPVNGHWIEGRAARREDLKRNNCVPVGGCDNVRSSQWNRSWTHIDGGRD